MFMKKILSLLMIILTVSFTALASPLSISEGNVDELTLYAPDGTILDPTSDIGETGMVIRTGNEPAVFSSVYGDIELEGNSLLAVTDFTISSPSLYLVYGEVNVTLTENLPITVYTPASSVHLPGSGEYGFTSTDSTETFQNLSGRPVIVYDGIRGIEETVEPMESLDYLVWPRHVEEPMIPSTPSLVNDIAVTPDEPQIIEIEREVRIPSSPAVEPSISVSVEPIIITIEKGVPAAPEIGEPEIFVAENEATITDIGAETEETTETEPAPVITEEEEETVVPAPEESTETQPNLPPVSAITPMPEKEDEGSFDLRIGARVYGNQNGKETARAFIQPSYTKGDFTLALNLDPFAIAEGIKAESAAEWIAFIADFIDEISYSGEDVTLAVDRTSYLEGDTAGLFTGLNHRYDGAYSALSLNHSFSSKFYSHRIWFDDLSFRRFPAEYKGNGGLELTLRTGDSYPLTITLGGVATILPDSIKASTFYPEAALYIPVMWDDDFNIGIKAGAATMYGDDYSVNPFTENGMLIAASIPMSYNGFSAELGAAWSTGKMHYGMLGNTLYAPVSGDYVTIRAKAGYNGDFFGVSAEGWTDIDLTNTGIAKDNSYLDTSAYVNLWGVKLFGGYRAQFLEDDINGEYYAGLGADMGPLYSDIMLSYKADDGLALTFASTISAFGKDKEESESFSSSLPVGAELETGIEYLLGDEETLPVFTVTPKVFIGNDDYSIGLRVPLRMTFSGSDFSLGGFNGYSSWDFGKDETVEEMKIYRAVTDSFALIDSINLGNPDRSIAYLEADRGYRKDGVLFSNYGTDEALAFRAGFNFPNLALSVYADNAEAPHIVEGGIVFYPGEFGGPSFGITVPGEILMESSFRDYALLFYPEFRVSVPIADRQYEISLYALGEVSSVYQDGEMTNSSIIYDFATSSMFDYMAGLEFSMYLDNIDFSIEGGIRNNGSLAPGMFSALSAARHDTAGTLDELAAATGNNELKYFAKAALALDFGFIDAEAEYSVSDLLGYGKEPGDYLYLLIGGNAGENVRLYASFAKDNFSSSFSTGATFASYMTTDALFALGADFNFGCVGFTAELQSSFADGRGNYVNVPAHKDSADILLSVKARLAL